MIVEEGASILPAWINYRELGLAHHSSISFNRAGYAYFCYEDYLAFLAIFDILNLNIVECQDPNHKRDAVLGAWHFTLQRNHPKKEVGIFALHPS